MERRDFIKKSLASVAVAATAGVADAESLVGRLSRENNENSRKMKVLLVNGSAHRNGNTFTALTEIAKTLEAEGIASEIFQIGHKAVHGCVACGGCKQNGNGRCVFDDDIANQLMEKARDADGFVFGTPTYYGQPNGALLAAIQRAMYADGKDFEYKPVATLAVCRRGGASMSFSTMNMPFEMMNMPIVTSQYWNIAYGAAPGEASQDAEGMQTMRTLARNMSWMLKNLRGEGATPHPKREPWQMTNFIR